LLFVALNLPSYLFELLPVAALIGALLGLGNLARGSELIVMRASGVTTARFCLWLGAAGLVISLAMFAVGEYVAPPLGQYARQLKVFSKFNEFSLAGNKGTWVRDGNTILSVAQQSASNRFGGIKVFQLDSQRRLQAVGRAESARLASDRVWRLEDYAETAFVDGGTRAARKGMVELTTSLAPEFLGLAVLEPDSMGMADLRAYVAHLQRNELNSDRYRTAFWSRLARLASVSLVLMLALPFALGSLRNAGQGARTVIGVLIGAGFILLSRTLESSGQLFNLPPWVVGWLPTILLAALTSILLWRTR